MDPHSQCVNRHEISLIIPLQCIMVSNGYTHKPKETGNNSLMRYMTEV